MIIFCQTGNPLTRDYHEPPIISANRQYVFKIAGFGPVFKSNYQPPNQVKYFLCSKQKNNYSKSIYLLIISTIIINGLNKGCRWVLKTLHMLILRAEVGRMGRAAGCRGSSRPSALAGRYEGGMGRPDGPSALFWRGGGRW
jgi:hypothetical protein